MINRKTAISERVRQYITDHPGVTRVQICAGLSITGDCAGSALAHLVKYNWIYSQVTNRKARYYRIGGSGDRPVFGVSPGMMLLNQCLAKVRGGVRT